MKCALCRDARPWIQHDKLQTLKRLAAQRGMSRLFPVWRHEHEQRPSAAHKYPEITPY